ncbi:MAG: GNAT family N-acetyltransferase [Dehalococcoidales bacterium]|nr:MAG: GNAT family N-acetyltransferase [Dehalococcoidales bacterium]
MRHMEITIRPITADEIDRVPLRCWPDREAIARLFTRQGTIGMGAWEQEKCVAQLHGYRITEPDDLWEIWPDWNRPHWAEKVRTGEFHLPTPAWCHACFHVGRTRDTHHDELLQRVLWLAYQSDWDIDRTYTDISKLDGVFLSRTEVEQMIKELQESGRRSFVTEAPEYRSQGIGTALCQESVRWARDHDFAVVVGSGAPDGLFEFAVWAGNLPWTSYSNIGFEPVPVESTGAELPGWAQGNSPPQVMAAVRTALAGGRPTHEFHERPMVLKLK